MEMKREREKETKKESQIERLRRREVNGDGKRYRERDGEQ